MQAKMFGQQKSGRAENQPAQRLATAKRLSVPYPLSTAITDTAYDLTLCKRCNSKEFMMN